MNASRLIRYLRAAWFSKEPGDRQLFRLVRRGSVRRVVEVGIDRVDRTAKLLDLCKDHAPGDEVLYSGFDCFEERPAERPPLTLIDTHRRLRQTGVSVRLTPGDPASAAAAMANALADTDLLLVSSGFADDELARLWRYVPRMCHPGTVVLRGETEAWRQASLQEVCQLGDPGADAQAA